MSKPPVLLLRTAGTNCDEETAFAFETSGAEVTPVHIRKLCEESKLLKQFKIIALPGGFSYGDDLGSGVVLAHELSRRLEGELREFVDQGGLVIGICNGFQVLIRSGLLPDVRSSGTGPQKKEKDKDKEEKVGRGATLTFNDSQVFEDRWVWLKVGESESPFLRGKAGDIVTFPVAHGEGKFVARDKSVLRRLKQGNRIAFQYVSADGDSAAYPENPNGSDEDIAGITDKTGRILGMMPHPERHVLPWQHPRWTKNGLKDNPDGLFLFKNAVSYAAES